VFPNSFHEHSFLHDTKILGALKGCCRWIRQAKPNPRRLVTQIINFMWWHLMLEHNYFSFLFSNIQNVDQFTCPKQKAPDNNKGHSSLQNCGSSL
jgi:hypothetical protein